MPEQPELTPEGYALIKSYEGFSGKPYYDGAQYSIGWGTEATYEDMVNWQDSSWGGISIADADARMEWYVNTVAIPETNRALEVTLSPEEYAGLISFAYNVGGPQASPVIDLINQGNMLDAANYMQTVVWAGGAEPNAALISRRADEVQFLQGVVPERATYHMQIHTPALPASENPEAKDSSLYHSYNAEHFGEDYVPHLAKFDLTNRPENKISTPPPGQAWVEEESWWDKLKGAAQDKWREITRPPNQESKRDRILGQLDRFEKATGESWRTRFRV